MSHSAKIAIIVIAVVVTLIGCGCMVFFLGAPKHDSVIMIGHRGYSSKNPDNTDVSFIRAAEHGSKGVETDVRITKDGELFAIETNTLPGMTPTSLLPQQAACVGITYSQLIDLIIDKSLEIKR